MNNLFIIQLGCTPGHVCVLCESHLRQQRSLVQLQLTNKNMADMLLGVICGEPQTPHRAQTAKRLDDPESTAAWAKSCFELMQRWSAEILTGKSHALINNNVQNKQDKPEKKCFQ